MSWDTIRGHDAAIRLFEQSVKKGRLGHAYLFTGPNGIGKKTFAKELAKTLLCEGSQNGFAACDVCPACKQVAGNTHPDLLQVSRPEDVLELPIKVIRESIEQLSLKPSRGGRKVGIFDDIDDINEEAANAFLKTLEEPPPNSLLILIGGPNSETQLRTILSRCQIVRFHPLSAANLRTLLTEHGIVESARIDRLIRLAGGSLGDAIALNDDALWSFRERLLEALSAKFVDSFEFGKIWLEFLDGAGKEPASKRRRAAVVLRMMLHLLRDALRLTSGVEPGEADTKELSVLRHLADRLRSERLTEWCERTIDADQQVDRRVQVDLIVEGYADYLGR